MKWSQTAVLAGSIFASALLLFFGHYFQSGDKESSGDFAASEQAYDPTSVSPVLSSESEMLWNTDGLSEEEIAALAASPPPSLQKVSTPIESDPFTAPRHLTLPETVKSIGDLTASEVIDDSIPADQQIFSEELGDLPAEAVNTLIDWKQEIDAETPSMAPSSQSIEIGEKNRERSRRLLQLSLSCRHLVFRVTVHLGAGNQSPSLSDGVRNEDLETVPTGNGDAAADDGRYAPSGLDGPGR